MWFMAGDGELSEGEKSVLTLHPHWAIMLLAAVKMVGWLAAAVAAAMLVALMSAAIAQDVLEVATALALAEFLFRFLRWRTTTYQLTARRLQLRSGILSRSGRDFPLIRISSVSFSSGPLGRLLDFGRLVVESPGQHGQLVLDGIPHVERVHATLFRLVEEEQARLAREGNTR